MGKGENAGSHYFLLFQQCLQKPSPSRSLKPKECVAKISPFPKQALVFLCLHYKSFENTVGKGETKHDKQFLLFPLFSTNFENFLPSLSNLKLLSANSFSLEESKICHLGKG